MHFIIVQEQEKLKTNLLENLFLFTNSSSIAKLVMFKDIVQIVSGIFFFFQAILHAQPLVQLAFIKSNGSVPAVQSEGNSVYFSEIRGSFSFFKSVDISRTEHAIVIDSFLTLGTIQDFDLNEENAYLAMADNEFGLRILNIADPANIQEVSFAEGTETFGTFYNEGFLYVADGGGLKIYDVFQADTLKLIWAYNTSSMYGDAIDIFVQGNLIYLNVFQTGLFIFNQTVRNLLGIFPSLNIGFGIATNDNYAYISDANNGFIAIDVRNPQRPVQTDALTGS